MSVSKSILVFSTLVLSITLVQCTEFVPVFMWSTSRANEKVPALHKISQDSFKDDVLEHLKENPFVIVFAEQTLSPEDFAQHDQSGATVFPHLEKHKRDSKVSYLPYVQNPIKALKHLGEEVTEVSISDLKEDFDFPETNVLIVNLNDAKDDEHRLEMLKRHDSAIMSIYNKIAKKYDNVLALYTAHHTSWVAPEDVITSRKIRSLLATTENGSYYKNGNSILYYTQVLLYVAGSADNTEVALDFTDQLNDTTITLIGTPSSSSLLTEVKMDFTTNTSAGYWILRDVNVAYNGETYYLNSSLVDIYAPTSFSYHCGDQNFSSESNNFHLYFGSFQVQLFFEGNSVNDTKFSDAYDCVGFTSVPIWSGIFVSAILLLIMTLGITMMMDIRTMDRFDDAKGKTITINAE